MKFQKREYQTKAIKTVFERLNKGIKSQLLVMATGLGKTYVATRISEGLDKKRKGQARTLFVAHREELIDQAVESFNDIHPMNIGIIKGPRFEVDKKIVVASVQTLTNRLDSISADYFDLVFYDESHHYMAKTYLDVVNHFTPRLSIGLTATPDRLDGLSLGNIFDEISFQYGIEEGIKEKFLCELQGIRTQTTFDISKVKKVGNEFNKTQLSLIVNCPERNELIVDKYMKFTPERQGIFFCVDMKHAMDLNDVFLSKGIKSEFVVSDESLCPDRKERIQRFKAGITTVLTNVMILTEGFNHHDVGVIGMARPTTSRTVYIQMVGRGTRPKSKEFIEKFNGNNCVILDFVDNTGNHKIINSYTLDKDKKLEDKVFMTKKRKMILGEIKEERERKLKALYEKDELVDLFSLPTVKVFAQNGKMREEATEKQIKWLKDLGLYEEGLVYTKGHASEILTNFPAKDYMIKQLAQWGYDIRQGATQGQYYAVKAEMEVSTEGINKENTGGQFSFGKYN